MIFGVAHVASSPFLDWSAPQNVGRSSCVAIVIKLLTSMTFISTDLRLKSSIDEPAFELKNGLACRN